MNFFALLLDRIEQASSGIIVATLAGILSGVGWLVRRVFTNQKQIELTQVEIRHRDKERSADRAMIEEIRTDQKAFREEQIEMRTEILGLFRNHNGGGLP